MAADPTTTDQGIDPSFAQKLATGYFFGNNPNINAELRQRIALQLMATKRAYPKNIGEGLSSIGDSFTDAMNAKALMNADLAQQGAATTDRTGVVPPAAQTSALPAAAANANAMMPPDDGGGGGDWRASAAAAMMPGGTAVGVPSPNPTSAGAVMPPSDPTAAAQPPGGQPPDQRVAMADPTGGVVSDIQQAPAVPSGIRQAPQPVRVAQAGPMQPPGDPGYVAPLPQRPNSAPIVPPTAREIYLSRAVIANPYFRPELETLTAARAIRQNELNKIFEADVQRGTAQTASHYSNLADQASRQNAATTANLANQKSALELPQAAVKAGIGAQTGQDPAALFTQLELDKGEAQKADNIIRQSQLVSDALKHDVITGYGAERRLDMAKAKAYWLNSGKSEDLATYTERLQAALKSTLSAGLENLQSGKSGMRLTPGAIDIASGTTGADPTATKGAIQAIVAENARIARLRLGDYESKVDNSLGKFPGVAKNYQFTTTPSAPDQYTQLLLRNSSDPAARANYDKRFGEGAAELEIARAQRRARQGG